MGPFWPKENTFFLRNNALTCQIFLWFFLRFSVSSVSPCMWSGYLKNSSEFSRCKTWDTWLFDKFPFCQESLPLKSRPASKAEILSLFRDVMYDSGQRENKRSEEGVSLTLHPLKYFCYERTRDVFISPALSCAQRVLFIQWGGQGLNRHNTQGWTYSIREISSVFWLAILRETFQREGWEVRSILEITYSALHRTYNELRAVDLWIIFVLSKIIYVRNF